MKTSKELVSYAQKALKERWGYVWGTFGKVLTPEVLAAKLKQYPEEVGGYKDFIEGNWLNRPTSDCVGLIKSCIWYDGQSIKYDAATDVSANGMYQMAKEKGAINTMPNRGGICLWKKGHIGIYIGGGEVIEANSTKRGVIKTPLTGHGATAWTHWLECPFISYEVDKPVKPVKPAEPSKSDEFEEALQHLVDLKIVSAQPYWKDNAKAGKIIKGEYARQLILNIYRSRK